MRELPQKNYNGLTIVLGHRSRHDTVRLISGTTGTFFDYYCLASNGVRRDECDIRLNESLEEGLLPNTKCILLLGEEAMHNWCPEYKEYSLNEQRGCPLRSNFKEVITIASYLPQDSCDITSAHEQKHNPHLKDLPPEEDEDDKDADVKMRHGKTKRKNWSFWLQQDTKKIVSALTTGIPAPIIPFKFKVYPTIKEIDELSKTAFGQYIYLDIETITETNALDISVVSFAIGNSIIYTIPIIRWTYDFAYSTNDFVLLLRALSRLMINNIPVLHNAMFDLFILAFRFKIPVGPNVQDTLLMWHRLWPEADKSLGHVMSALTWEEYHKDSGIFNPKSIGQEQQLWRYNALDVHGTRLIHLRLLEEGKKRIGVLDSMTQANSMIRPYLIAQLQGINFSEEERKRMIALNDRWQTVILRIITLLIGEDIMRQIKPKGSSKTLASSSQQCVKYFHDLLGYPICGRSKKTGNPSLDEKNFYKLALKLKDKGLENPIIELVLLYRSKAKETGSLKFNPWKEGVNTTSWSLAGTETFRLASRKLLA